MEKIAEVIDIDTSEFEITMKFKLKTSDPMSPVTIQTNDDVEFFRFQFNFTFFFNNFR